MTDKATKHILWFKEVGIKDIPLVGGKNAALGEMISALVPLGVKVPDGFAITASAYNYFINSTGLRPTIEEMLKGLNTSDFENLKKCGLNVRNAILSTQIPTDLATEIREAYLQLSKLYGENLDVAVRSSATAEDLPGASFAGQQETYLNVVGEEEVMESVKKAIASLFTDRAISYRVDKGFSHLDVALSVGVQRMVRSDLASSGIVFTIDTETGFDKVVIINSSYGLGELVVQGKVTPDEFMVFKPTLSKHRSIISKKLGVKDQKLVYDKKYTVLEEVPAEDIGVFSLTDDEILQIAKWAVQIEEYFSKLNGEYRPMDIEWAKDGKTGDLFIIQARPETIHALSDKNIYQEFNLKEKGELLVKGTAVGSSIATGKIKVISDPKDLGQFNKGEILVTEITDPDWEPIMKIASAIVTDKGGRTSHAAIVSRELGIPAIVGTVNSTQVLKTGTEVTVDCSSGTDGLVYQGTLKFEVVKHELSKIPKIKTKILVNIGTPDEAFRYHALPVSGVGLGRLEFIIASKIQVHPNVLINYEELKKSGEQKELIVKVEKLTQGYTDKKQYYVDKLAEGIAKIGATFWPNEVIIRFSDFKTNEYRALLGGDLYEPHEENPMLGWRGASRYYHEKFKEAFGLECLALKKVREGFGLENVVGMVPFCRTPEEGQKVIDAMAANGLDRAKDTKLKIYVMCEIPSNILLANKFFEIFDGMSIGSNDLTQLVLGLDRDSNIVNKVANENDPSVKILIKEVIQEAKELGKYIGICGQAPSDYEDFAQFLVDCGIESISLNPDTVIKTLINISQKEGK